MILTLKKIDFEKPNEGAPYMVSATFCIGSREVGVYTYDKWTQSVKYEENNKYPQYNRAFLENVIKENAKDIIFFEEDMPKEDYIKFFADHVAKCKTLKKTIDGHRRADRKQFIYSYLGKAVLNDGTVKDCTFATAYNYFEDLDEEKREGFKEFEKNVLNEFGCKIQKFIPINEDILEKGQIEFADEPKKATKIVNEQPNLFSDLFI